MRMCNSCERMLVFHRIDGFSGTAIEVEYLCNWGDLKMFGSFAWI